LSPAECDELTFPVDQIENSDTHGLA
jgi:hypothetical protein